MTHSIFDVTGSIYDQIDRLMNADGDDIEMESQRADALTNLTKQMLDVSKHQLDIIKVANDLSDDASSYAARKMLGSANG